MWRGPVTCHATAPTRGAPETASSAPTDGSVLIPLGVIFIMLGWYGAARARVVQQQIPYLLSGSFVGLGCMVVGGLFF
jgi:hypothetical protein